LEITVSRMLRKTAWEYLPRVVPCVSVLLKEDPTSQSEDHPARGVARLEAKFNLFSCFLTHNLKFLKVPFFVD
jgi:hypothetical protein